MILETRRNTAAKHFNSWIQKYIPNSRHYLSPSEGEMSVEITKKTPPLADVNFDLILRSIFLLENITLAEKFIKYVAFYGTTSFNTSFDRICHCRTHLSPR